MSIIGICDSGSHSSFCLQLRADICQPSSQDFWANTTPNPQHVAVGSKIRSPLPAQHFLIRH
jgi:hypothetical protein